MITLDELKIVTGDEFRHSVEQNIELDPTRIALSKGLANAALVATQVKYLQRARKKLPTYFDARATIPSLAFEQSSSEQTASMRAIEGGHALDLTCGLGVDSLYLSHGFEHVTAIERNQTLVLVARHNFSLMGADNIEVINDSAEEFVERTTAQYDTIFIDPDRRSTTGQKLYRLEDCSPNVVEMMPRLRELAKRIVIKCSPLFDVDEAFRLFPDCGVEVVSSGGECKEVVIEIGGHKTLRISVWGHPTESFEPQRGSREPIAAPSEPRYLIVPEVALRKARRAVEYYTHRGIAMGSDNDFALAESMPEATTLGQLYAITSISPLKEFPRGGRATIMHRGSGMSTEQICSKLKIKGGGPRTIAVGRINGEIFVADVKII